MRGVEALVQREARLRPHVQVVAGGFGQHRHDLDAGGDHAGSLHAAGRVRLEDDPHLRVGVEDLPDHLRPHPLQRRVVRLLVVALEGRGVQDRHRVGVAFRPHPQRLDLRASDDRVLGARHRDARRLVAVDGGLAGHPHPVVDPGDRVGRGGLVGVAVVEEDMPDAGLPQQVDVLAGVRQVVGHQQAGPAELLHVAGARGVQHGQRGRHDRGQVAGLAHHDEGRVRQLLQGGNPLVQDVQGLAGVRRHVDDRLGREGVHLGLHRLLQRLDGLVGAEGAHPQDMPPREPERDQAERDRPQRHRVASAEQAGGHRGHRQAGEHVQHDGLGGGEGGLGVGAGVRDAGRGLRALGVVGQGRLAAGQPGGGRPFDDLDQHQAQHDRGQPDGSRAQAGAAQQGEHEHGADREPDVRRDAEPAQQQGLADVLPAGHPVEGRGEQRDHDARQHPAAQHAGDQGQPQHPGHRQVGARGQGVDPGQPAGRRRGRQHGPRELEGVAHPDGLRRVRGVRRVVVAVVPLVGVRQFLVAHRRPP